jgi:hypothetical protein
MMTTRGMVMRANICEPADAPALARFRLVLQSLVAELLTEFGSSLDVQLLEVRIGGQMLHIFADAWSVEIEGPPALVEPIAAMMADRPN